MANKKKKSQIEQKDLADDVSKILGDLLDNLKSKSLQIGFDHLLTNCNADDIKKWRYQQINDFGAFKTQLDKLINTEKKTLQKSLENGLSLTELNGKQMKSIQKEVNRGILKLKESVISTQASNIEQVSSQATKVLKSNVTDALKEIISSVITKTNDYGIVTYKNGRKMKWENYMEMKVRTDIQNDIADNMVKTGSKNGIIFYVATYHGDCAPDHADFQGKIYCAKGWKSICPKEYLDKVSNYISTHDIMSVEDVMGPKGNYLTKRPNCRHYFQYISIQEVLDVKNDGDLDKLREHYNLNSAGKYKPEKYEALKKQRYNERQIRKLKGQIETQEKLASSFNDKTSYEEILKRNSNLKILNLKLKDAQKSQRELINSKKGILVRNYDREAYQKMVSDFRIEKPTSLKNKSTYDNMNIDEFYRAKSRERTNIKPISNESFKRLMIRAEKLGATYVRGETWVEEHLDKTDAAASSIGSVLLFRKQVTKSEVLEEIYHVEQNLRKLNNDKEFYLRKILNEIDAKEYLLKVAKKYKIPRQEIEESQMQLEEYKKLLEEYKKKDS